jgi:hypothetical protein
MVRATLTCHSATPCSALRRIDARVRLAHDGALSFAFAATGDAASVRVPAPVEPRQTDGLWEHTCFEAFIRARGTAYYELNWSPSGEWAVYRFDDYRAGAVSCEIERPPTIELNARAFGFEMNTVLSLSEMPELIGSSKLEIALAAVIEATDGRRSYWALAHPSATPDFHHPESFVLELAQNLLARAGGGR